MSLDIQPDFGAHGPLGFPAGEDRGRQLLAVAVEGHFASWFSDRPSPLAVGEEDPAGGDETWEDSGAATGEDKPDEADEGAGTEGAPVITRVIERSPEAARIILFASGSFLTDDMLDLAASGLGTRYLNPVQLVENAIDWTLEDRGLLAIRGRGHFSRTLDPLDRESRVFWEYLNYALALLAVLLVWVIRRQRNRRMQMRYAALLGSAEQGEA